MNFLKRAWLSVMRRKGKTILLFSLIFVIANIIAGAISIQQATKNVEGKIKSTLGAIATIQPDYEKLNKLSPEEQNSSTLIKELPISTIEQIGKSPYVKYFDYNTHVSMGSESLKPYVPEKSEEIVKQNPFASYTAFGVKGINYPEILDIKEKKIQLADGRVFTQEEVTKGSAVALISKKVAEVNSIKVGDTITLSLYDLDFEGQDKPQNKLSDYALKVIGIYEAPATKKTSKKSDGQEAFEEMSRNNNVYAPNAIVVRANKEEMANYQAKNPDQKVPTETYYNPIYVLNKPEDVDKFKEENQALLPQYYSIQASSDKYDVIAAPVQSMSKLAGSVLMVAVIAAILIITLVVLLFLRDRKHELGIYLSFGEKKGKIFGQILAEVLVTAFVAVSLSVVTGNLIAKGVSGNLIQQQMESQTPNGKEFIGGPADEFTPEVQTEDIVKTYQVSLTPGYVLIMYVVGMGTVLLATVVPLGYILRLNPKKIMM